MWGYPVFRVPTGCKVMDESHLDRFTLIIKSMERHHEASCGCKVMDENHLKSLQSHNNNNNNQTFYFQTS
jgi:hypothetical protein